MPSRNLNQSVNEERLKLMSDKIKAHDMQLAVVQELYRVIVTGDLDRGKPGMLENNRTTSEAISRMEIKLSGIDGKLSGYAELEARVREIEERHARVDKENETKKSEIRTYRYYFITLGISNLVTLLWLWLKPT
jgi:hypothetical protein